MDLSTTLIKDSRQALLTLENNGTITTSLQRMQDGAGNDVAVQVSSEKIRIDLLEIATLNELPSSVKSLVEDSSTGEIGYRTVSGFGGIEVTVADGNNPIITIIDEVGGGGPVQLLAGGGIVVSAESGVITISKSAGPQNVITGATTLTVADSGKTFHLQLDPSTGFDVSLPPVAAGLEYKFVIETKSTVSHHIHADSSESDYFYGKVSVHDNTFTDCGTQSVSRATANAAAASYDAFVINSARNDTGGIDGDVIHVTGRDGSGWHVNALLGSDHGGVFIAAPIEAQ